MTTQPQADLRAQVKAALTTTHISQAEAARRLGLSAKHMSHMLTGRATLTLDWADRILTLCGMTLAVAAIPDTEKAQPERIALDDLTSDALDTLYEQLDRAERVAQSAARDAALALTAQLAAEATVARVRQAVDAGPVGSCCAHLIHAALNPPPAVKRRGCGRPAPGPCQPCPDNSPSLHCACVCEPEPPGHGEGAAGA